VGKEPKKLEALEGARARAKEEGNVSGSSFLGLLFEKT
jgi:hypothetical protein